MESSTASCERSPVQIRYCPVPFCPWPRDIGLALSFAPRWSVNFPWARLADVEVLFCLWTLSLPATKHLQAPRLITSSQPTPNGRSAPQNHHADTPDGLTHHIQLDTTCHIGRRKREAMPRSDEAQAFFHAVYSAVQEIPPGKVTSYEHIARLVGERELPPPPIVFAVQLTSAGMSSPAPPPSRRMSKAPPEPGGLEPRASGRRWGRAAAAVPSWECAVAEGGECQGGDFAEVSAFLPVPP